MFTAGSVRWLYDGHAGLGRIAAGLRQGDVHPPLYFWVLEVWRQGVGPSWFAARLLSVLFTLAGLYGLSRIARLCRLPAWPVLAMALLSYGFIYTGILARPFALAQALNIAGVACALRAAHGRRVSWAWLAGAAFGAAAFTDYLAVFTGAAMLAWLCGRRGWRALPALAAMLPFLAVCFWFFLAQHSARDGQFAPFAWNPALLEIMRDGGAALFGGLPLYAGMALSGAAGGAMAACLALLFLAALACAVRTRQGRGFLLLAAATPAGLLALGVAFRNTPIEIRYLAFALPWVALAFAPVLPRLPLGLWLGAQAAAVAGLIFAPATMQPQGRAAHLAAGFPGALVALPYGNDGVGLPGPFIAAAPDAMRLILLRPGDDIPPGAVRVAIQADARSRAVAAAMACPTLVCGP